MSVRSVRSVCGASALLLLAGAMAACSDAPAAANVGASAPEYSTRSLAGDSVSLAALKGKVVLLNVWATWCHPCREEIPQLERLHQLHGKNGLEVVGVSVDAAGMDSGIRDFAREFNMTYPLWLDPDERISTQFLTIGVPSTFLIDRQGVIRWRKTGAIKEGDAELASAISKALAG